MIYSSLSQQSSSTKQGVGGGRRWEQGKGMGRTEEYRVGGKVEHREHHSYTHRPLAWSCSQMDTAQNHAHQRQSEYCGDSPRNHREDLLPGCKTLVLWPELTFSYYN